MTIALEGIAKVLWSSSAIAEKGPQSLFFQTGWEYIVPLALEAQQTATGSAVASLYDLVHRLTYLHHTLHHCEMDLPLPTGLPDALKALKYQKLIKHVVLPK